MIYVKFRSISQRISEQGQIKISQEPLWEHARQIWSKSTAHISMTLNPKAPSDYETLNLRIS